MKDDILFNAFLLFIEKGYKAFTMKELEIVSGMTKGAFYYHYRNKKEIIESAIEKYCFSSRENLNPDAEKDLKSFISKKFRVLEARILDYKASGIKFTDPYSFTLFIEIKEFIPSIKDKIRTQYYQQINQWEKAIENAKKSGEIKSNIESHYFAEIFMSIGIGLIRNMVLEEESIEISIAKLRIQYDQIYSLMRKDF